MPQSLQNGMRQRLGISAEGMNSRKGILKEYLRMIASEAIARAKPIVRDIAMSTRPIFLHFRNESKQFLTDFSRVFQAFDLTDDEIQLKESLQFIISKFNSTLSRTKFFQYIQSKIGGGSIRNKFMSFIQKLKDWYAEITSGSGAGLSQRLAELKQYLAETYDRFAKRWYLKISRVVVDFRYRVRQWLKSKWHAVYHNYKAHIITTLNDIEVSFTELMNAISSE